MNSVKSTKVYRGSFPRALALLICLLALSACGQASNSGQDDAARQQFLSERGGGTPQAGQEVTNTVDSSAGGPQMFTSPGGAGGAFGTVDSVDSASSTITVKNPMDGTTTKVHLASGGKVYRQVDALPSDLTVGANIVAMGTQDGDTINADMVQIGIDLTSGSGTTGRPVMSFNNGVPPGSNPSQGDSIAPQGAGPDQGTSNYVAPPPSVSGAIEKIDGDTLTVKTQDGKTAIVQLTNTTRLQKQTEGDLSTLKQGETIAATGEQKGDTFEATRIQVMQMITQPIP